MKKKLITGLVVLLVVAALVVSSECFYTVEEDEYANVVRFSKTVDTVSEAGLYVKLPFVDTVKKFPNKILLYDMKPSEVLTADSKTMLVDNYVMWKITDPL
ncbi:MAG: SPFH domain-containing protein, partial [Eubacteriales bacterium]